MTNIVRKPSAHIRSAFEQWLALECKAGLRLAVLEGITGSGKTRLTKTPFHTSAGLSTNIELDDFLKRPVPKTTAYVDAIDRLALASAIDAAIASTPLVVVQGAIARPFVCVMAGMLGKDRVRRVYLKRMAKLQPDFWQDEDFIADPDRWPPTAFHRSIYQYHAEQRPWFTADLLLERIEDDQ